MEINQYTNRIELVWKSQTPYDPNKSNHDIIVKNVQIRNAAIVKDTMPEELKIAINAWDSIYNTEGQFNKKLSHKNNIETWLKNNYPKLSTEAFKRISTVVNMNKKGGATPSGEY